LPPVSRALGPALALPEVVFLILGPLVGLQLVRDGRWRTVPRAGFGLSLIVMAGLGPSVLFAGDRRRAAAQLAVLVYVALIAQLALAVRALGRQRQALMGLVLGSVLACVLGLVGMALLAAGRPALGWASHHQWLMNRPIGPTESATMLSVIAVPGLLAAGYLARRMRAARPYLLLAATLLGTTILLTQSRVGPSVLAGLGLMLAVWPGAPYPRLRRVLGLGALALGLLVVGLSLTYRLFPLSAHWPFIDTTLSNYRVRHEVAWAAFRDHPLVGVGLENFHRIWFRYYLPARHDPAYGGGAEHELGHPFDPHGTVQGYLAEAGLLGLATLAAVVIWLWRHRPRPAGSAIETLGFLVAVACALFFTDVLTERSTFAALGLLWLTSRPDTTTGATTPDSASQSPGTRR
jgi:O-antigen ligase